MTGYQYDDRYCLTEVTKNSQLVGLYQYDANGRLSQTTTGTDVTTYDYDSQGRLKQVQTPDHTIDYRLNALGNRVAKVKDGDVVERYLWQDKTTLLATYDGDGNLKQRFEYTLGHAPTNFTENGNTYYLLTDQLGSPRVITDSAGQVVKAVEYDAYGNVISDSNPGFEIPFGFAGGDTNLYGYVLGNPVNGIDLNGFQSFDVASSFGFTGGHLPQSSAGAEASNRLPDQYNVFNHYGKAWLYFVPGGGGGGGLVLKACKFAVQKPEMASEIVKEIMSAADGEGVTMQKLMDAFSSIQQQQIQQQIPGASQTSLQGQAQRLMNGGQ